MVTNAATLPLTWYWLRNNAPIGVITTMQHSSFYTPPVVLSNTTYRVVVSNLFGPPGVASTPVTLTMLADSDRDGLPDAFEDFYELDRGDSIDAVLDSDGDGLTNLQEYMSGTSPRDPSNTLRINQVQTGDIFTAVEFFAGSNRTYSLQFTDGNHNPPDWLTLTNIPARATNRTEVVLDPYGARQRYYRLVSPRQP